MTYVETIHSEEVSIDVGLDVVCSECGSDVDAEFTEFGDTLKVGPCETCKEEADDGKGGVK